MMTTPRPVWTTEAPPLCDCIVVPVEEDHERTEMKKKKGTNPAFSRGMHSMWPECARRGSYDPPIVKNPTLRIPSMEKNHPSGEGEDTYSEGKKGYCRCRRAIGPRKDTRETVNIADDTLLFGHQKWLPHGTVLSPSLPPLPPSHFDADKSSLLKKHRASCCELIYERPIH